MPEKSTGYGVSMTRSITNPGWVNCTMRKHYWSVGTGSRSRVVCVAGFWAQGMGEREIVESMLRELLRAYVDEIA